MKAFATNEKQSAPAMRKIRSYVHQPMGTVQQAQKVSIQRILHLSGAQAKLTIGQPNDQYEQEADRVADQVMAIPNSSLQRQIEYEDEGESLKAKPLASQITPLVQKQGESPEEEVEPVQAKFNDNQTIQRMCPECESEQALQRQTEKDEDIQTKSINGKPLGLESDVEANINNLKGGGQPLDTTTRNFFEPRFGYDFSGVRVHHSGQAADISRSVNARAFTLGNNIAFGSGQYQPQSHDGKRLLGHELTHVIQQTNSAPSDHYIQREAMYIRSLQPGASSSTGHAFVTMEDAQNSQRSWGFYAHCASGPLGSQGCSDWELFQMGLDVALPGHVKRESSPSFDDSIRHQLTSRQYNSANAEIRARRRNPPNYELWSYNCVDFVRDIANTVGISIPNFPGIDEPEELSAYIRHELDLRLLRSGTLTLGRVDSGGSVVDISNTVTGSANAPHFQINNLPPQHNLRFRWIISDSQNRSYLMWGDAGQVFQYGRQFNAYIGSETRALLRSRNIRRATIKCRVNAGGSNRLFTLPVEFTW